MSIKHSITAEQLLAIIEVQSQIRENKLYPAELRIAVVLQHAPHYVLNYLAVVALDERHLFLDLELQMFFLQSFSLLTPPYTNPIPDRHISTIIFLSRGAIPLRVAE